MNMFISVFAYLFIFFGLLILVLPLLLIELGRPRDWLMGGLFLFLGLFLIEENDVLSGSINLFITSMIMLFGKMIQEISQTRWNQLTMQEKKQIGSFQRWLESLKQLGQMFAFLGKTLLTFFQRFKNESKKPSTEKKWVRPDKQEEIKNKTILQAGITDSKKISNSESTKKEESS